MRTIIIIVLAIAIVGFIVFMPSKPAKTPQDKAYDAVKTFMLSRLDNPDSYEPSGFEARGATGGWNVYHVFRATNGFGAKVRHEAVFFVDSAYHVELKQEY